MTPHPLVGLPPIPADTLRAAQAVFGKGNFYVNIGDQAGTLLAGIDPADLDRTGGKSAVALMRLALGTIFQYMERLPDYQASEAARLRTDWKYALHLALDHPGIPPRMLCDFRQRLLLDPVGQHIFDQILGRLATPDLLAGSGQPHTNAEAVLTAVCTLSRVEELVRAMSLALEMIAIRRPHWLLKNSLPHWYERYNHAPKLLRQLSSGEGWDGLIQAIGADAEYLLRAVAESHESGLGELPEISALREECRRQYEQVENETCWRPRRCADCGAAAA